MEDRAEMGAAAAEEVTIDRNNKVKLFFDAGLHAHDNE